MTVDSPFISEDVRAIEALLDGFASAVARGDADRLSELMCKDVTVVFTGSRGIVHGRDDARSVWADHAARWAEVTVSRRQTRVRIHGDSAWASFTWDGQGRVGADVYRVEGERWTVVAVWEQGGWRVAQAHSSLPQREWSSFRRAETGG